MGVEDARLRRAERSAALAALRTGQVRVAELLLRPPTPLQTTDLWEVLLACPKLGRAGARQVLERAQVFAHVRMEELTPHQRRCLVDALPPRAKGT